MDEEMSQLYAVYKQFTLDTKWLKVKKQKTISYANSKQKRAVVAN